MPWIRGYNKYMINNICCWKRPQRRGSFALWKTIKFVARPRTLQETHKWAERHWENRCLWAWNTDHVINTWIAGGFFKTHKSRSKEICGYKETHAHLFHCMQFDYKPTTLFHKYDSLSEPSWALLARQPGCLVVIFPWAGTPLKEAPWDRETFN